MQANELDRALPHDAMAERSVLACLLLGEAAPTTPMPLRTDDFFVPSNRLIFDAIAAVRHDGLSVDEGTVSDRLRRDGLLEEVGGLSELLSITEAAPSAGRLPHYARILQAATLRRGLISSMHQIVERATQAPDDVAGAKKFAEEKMFAVATMRGHADLAPTTATIPLAMEVIEKAIRSSKKMSGISSGFKAIDEISSGFSPGDLIIVAARPGMGKTSLALTMAQRVAVRGQCHVAFFSLEMDQAQLGNRMMCSEAKIDSRNFRNSKMTAAEWSRLTIGAGRLSALPIYIDDTGSLSVVELRAKLQRLQAKVGVHIAFVDYLQLLSGRRGKDGREREVAEVSRSLKGMAKDLGIPIVVLSQLNRNAEKRDGKRPQLSDLRESGAIEQDADLVCFVYREGYYDKECDTPREAEVIVAKNRNGPTDTALLAFDAAYTRFDDLRAY